MFRTFFFIALEVKHIKINNISSSWQKLSIVCNLKNLKVKPNGLWVITTWVRNISTTNFTKIIGTVLFVTLHTCTTIVIVFLYRLLIKPNRAFPTKMCNLLKRKTLSLILKRLSSQRFENIYLDKRESNSSISRGNVTGNFTVEYIAWLKIAVITII